MTTTEKYTKSIQEIIEIKPDKQKIYLVTTFTLWTKNYIYTEKKEKSADKCEKCKSE